MEIQGPQRLKIDFIQKRTVFNPTNSVGNLPWRISRLHVNSPSKLVILKIKGPQQVEIDIYDKVRMLSVF